MADENKLNQALDTAGQIATAVTQKQEQPVSTTPEAQVDTSTQEYSGTKNITATTGTSVTANQDQTTQQQQQDTQATAEQQAPETTAQTPVATTPQSTTTTAYKNETYAQNADLKNYATKLGYSVQEYNGQLYINNTPVDYQGVGITSQNGIYSGTQAQYDQLLNNVKSSGYTSSLGFNDYATQQGFTIGNGASNYIWTVNGKEVDFSQYTSYGMKLVNGKWAGTEEAYKKILEDVQARADQNLIDFLKGQNFSVQTINNKLYINNKEIDWKAEGLKKVFQNIVGTMEQYQQITKQILDSGLSNQTINDFLNSQGYTVDLQPDSRILNIDGQLFDLGLYQKEFQLNQVPGVGWGGSDELYQRLLADIQDRSDFSLYEYAQDQGMFAWGTSDSLYLNNRKLTLEELKNYGLHVINGQIHGTNAQFEQLLNDTIDQGYTTDLDFLSYADDLGIKIPKEIKETLKTVTVPGGTKTTTTPSTTKTVYKTVKKTVNVKRTTNISYGSSGSMVKELQKVLNKNGYNLAVDGQFGPLTRAAVIDYQRKKKLLVDGIVGPQTWTSLGVYDKKTTTEKVATKVTTPGKKVTTKLPDTKKTVKEITEEDIIDLGQFGLHQVDGQWVGSEDQYQAVIDWIQNKSQYNLNDYLNKQSSNTAKVSSDGTLRINNRVVSDDLIKSFGIKIMNGKVYGSEQQYNNLLDAVKSEGYGTNLDFEAYQKKSGTIEQDGDNYIINGKYVNLSKYAQYGMENVDGKWVGSETAYQKIQDDTAQLSEDTFDEFLDKAGSTFEERDGKIFVNGYNVTSTINSSGLEMVNGKLVGTEAQFIATLNKLEEPFTYKSAFEEEIQNALDEIKNFEAYQTPQETLDLIDQLIASAQEKFNYEPADDSALILAQKEAERQVREGSGTKGMLYSSGTMETATRKIAELIPQFEQAAYARFQAEQARTINVLNAVMQWDQMQADIHMDELTLLTNKFNAILDLDNRALQQFQAHLDQMNADRQYELDLQRWELEQRTAEITSAWEKVEQLGYVDEETSVILGVAVGTKAQWVKQLEQEQKNALALQKKQQEYDAKQAKKQQEIDKALVKYKAQLDAANAKKLAATQYEYDKKLAEQEKKNAIKLAKGDYGTVSGTLRYGSSGNDVKTLQKALNANGAKLAVDGSFGPLTQAAVKAYQKKKGLTVDGIVGPQTKKALGIG